MEDITEVGIMVVDIKRHLVINRKTQRRGIPLLFYSKTIHL